MPDKTAANVTRKTDVPAATDTSDAEDTGKTDANIARIVRLIQTRIDKDRSVATLRLDPPELGTVRMHMDLRQDQLALRIDADSPAARDLLLRDMDALRKSLEAAGIQLDRVEVRVPEAAPAGLDSQAAQQQGMNAATDGGAGRRDDAHSTDSRSEQSRPVSATRLADATAVEEPTIGLATESLVNVLA